MRRETGRHVVFNGGGERYRAFVPLALPPQPALDLSKLDPLREAAGIALGRRADRQIATEMMRNTAARMERIFPCNATGVGGLCFQGGG